MILPKYYKFYHDTAYVTYNLVENFHEESDAAAFFQFLSGQTVGHNPDNDDTMIYVCDYERWLRKHKPRENDGWD